MGAIYSSLIFDSDLVRVGVTDMSNWKQDEQYNFDVKLSRRFNKNR